MILVRPQHQGNVGAVARAMANTDLEELVVVEPGVEIGAEARARAVQAEHILDGLRREPSLEAALAPYARVVGTTSSRHRDLPVRLLTPRQLATELSAEDAERGRSGAPPVATALVFGPEASGLTREELSPCGRVVCIPASLRQPTLNLAQAVLVISYELYVARLALPLGQGEAESAKVDAALEPATAGELAGLFRQVEPILWAIDFARDDTFPGVLRDLRSLAARAAMSQRELAILRGICRRAAGTLRRLREPAAGN